MISKERRLGWMIAFLLLSGTFMHSEMASIGGVSPYYLFWTLFLGTFAVAVWLLATCNERKGEISLGATLLALFSLYVLTLRQQYISDTPAFGLDTYYEIGAIRIIQQTGFQAAASSPFPEVTDFPLVHVYAVVFAMAGNLDILTTIKLLVPFLSLLSLVFFALTARELKVPQSSIIAWSWVFVASTQFFILYYGRPLMGILLLAFLMYILIKWRHSRSLGLSIILVLLIVALTLSHQVSALVAMMLMAGIVLIERILRSRTQRNLDQRRMLSPTLIFFVLLVGYWLMVTISIPEWAGKLRVLLFSPPPLSATGFATSLKLRSGYVLQLTTLGLMSVLVLRQTLGKAGRGSSTIAPALILVSGLMLVLSLSIFAIATGLSVARYLLFIQFFVIVGFLVFLQLRSHRENAKWQRVSALLITSLLVSNLLLMPAYLVDANAPPLYTEGEIRLSLLQSEIRAMGWLPSNSKVLGDHHVQMARLYVQNDFLDPRQSAIHNTIVNESLIAGANFPSPEYGWFVFEQEYMERILDRSNNSFAQMGETQFQAINGTVSVDRVYDNGFVEIFYSP